MERGEWLERAEKRPERGQVWVSEFVSASNMMSYVPSNTRVILLRPATENPHKCRWSAVHIGDKWDGRVSDVWTGFSAHEQLIFDRMATSDEMAAISE